MPRSWFFALGDLAANLLAGLVAALLCHWLIDPGWNMFIAMLIAMLLGMFSAMLLALLLLMRYFGAMEVMLPTMLTGMLAGMWVGMRAAMGPLSDMDAAAYGLLCGLVVIGFCWAANGELRGSAEIDP